MKLIVGLGNPGKRYERTRHNIGAMVLDALCEHRSSIVPKAGWRERFDSLCCDAQLGTEQVVLIKPQTFMNKSGEAAQAARHFYKCAVTDLVVLHDDIDLPFCELRLRQGGGEGGHNGLKSISAIVGGADYFRIKLGVGRPALPPNLPQDARHELVSDWVLNPFSKSELAPLEGFLKRAGEGLVCLLENGLQVAQQRFHGSAA